MFVVYLALACVFGSITTLIVMSAIRSGTNYDKAYALVVAYKYLSDAIQKPNVEELREAAQETLDCLGSILFDK